MKKRFASFLFAAGKIATMTLLPHGGFASIKDFVTKQTPNRQHNELFDPESVTVLNTITTENYDIQFLFNAKGATQKILDLVITGLHDKDEVLVVVSPEKDTTRLLEMNPWSQNNSNEMKVLNHFSIQDISSNLTSKNSAKALSLPVDLAPLADLTKDGSSWYLHVLIAPNAQWDKSLIRYSEVYELKATDEPMLLGPYEDCTANTCSVY